MDPTVYFALGTLCVVFLISLFVLIGLCLRRRQQENARRRADVNFRFSRLRDDKVDNLVELSPLLNTELEKIEWVGAAEGTPFADVIAILRLTTKIVKVLSAVSINRASTKIYDVIAQSMFRVDTHFHELLEFTPAERADLRVIEARALTLTTTVWALNAAFTLHGFDQMREVEDMVITMYEHVDSLRQSIPGLARRRRRTRGEGEEGAEEEEETRPDGEEEEEEEEDEDNGESQATVESTVETIVTHSELPSASTSQQQLLLPQIQVEADVEQAADADAAAAAAATAAGDSGPSSDRSDDTLKDGVAANGGSPQAPPPPDPNPPSTTTTTTTSSSS